MKHAYFARVAAAIAVSVVAIGIWRGSFVAGAADAYGYVSQADLIAHGSLRVEQPFVRTLPWPFADWSFAPAGYRPGRERGVIVPTYPPGVPILMAAFERMANRQAVFYVVPLLGGIAVWMTFVLGASVHNELTGVLAALLLATSPSFLIELMAPASDVAATAWWTAALIGVVRGSAIGMAAGGLAASMAVLTRPNLVPLLVVLAAYGVLQVVRARDTERRRAMGAVALFVATSLPGCIVVAMLNQQLYGSPFRSGYEPVGALFQWSNVAPNLDRYPRWLLHTQTPFIALGILAPLLVRPRGRVSLLMALAAALCASYLFYRPFGRDEWTYLRFLLPAYPALLVCAVIVAFDVTRRLTTSDAPRTIIVTIVACTALAGWQARTAMSRGVLEARRVDRRYVDVGHYVATMLPTNALCIARLHAGSIRYYAGRLTLYYDWLQPQWLDEAVRELTARGYHPVIVVEADEEPGFRERFAAGNELGRLGWPPMAELSEPVRVRIYDPIDRERFRRGEPVATHPIAAWARFR